MPVETFEKLVELLRPSLERNAHMACVRTKSGVISVHIRVAMAIRMLAGGSYTDIALLFGVAIPTAFLIMWQVIDAIKKTPAVGPFYFPQTEECAQAAGKWKGLSTNGVFNHVVAVVDGFFIRCKKVDGVKPSEGSAKTGKGRPTLTTDGRLGGRPSRAARRHRREAGSRRRGLLCG
ncbi:unnamed protein product [Pylaiella littoralis]